MLPEEHELAEEGAGGRNLVLRWIVEEGGGVVGVCGAEGVAEGRWLGVMGTFSHGLGELGMALTFF